MASLPVDAMAKHKTSKLLMLLCGLLLAAVFCEVGIRVYRGEIDYMRPGMRLQRDAETWGDLVHRPSRIPGLDYELAPNVDKEMRGMRVRTNSLGMRGPEPLPRATPGLLRLLALGDSITFGYRVAEDEAWPEQLEAALAADPVCEGRTVDVLNLSCSGYTTEQEARLYGHRAPELDPDVVVLGYYFNDPDIEPTSPLNRHFMRPHWWQHSALLRWCAMVRRNQEIKRLGNSNFWRWLHHPETANWRSVLSGLDELHRSTEPRGVPVVMLIFPLIPAEDWEDYTRFLDLHAQVAAAGRERGFHVLDLYERFRQHDLKELILGDGDFHPTALGHRLVSEALMEFFRGQPELLCARGRN
jgi:lysophospholipase L1-like esterase